MKDLIINGILFAKYEISPCFGDTQDGNICYLHTLIFIFPENPALSEDCLAKIIERIENTKITDLAYLNIKE